MRHGTTSRMTFSNLFPRIHASRACQSYYVNHLRHFAHRSGPPFTQGDSRPRDYRRTRKGLHVLFRHKIHNFREYVVFFLYLTSTHGTCKIKMASLRWHSPMLDDISTVRSPPFLYHPIKSHLPWSQVKNMEQCERGNDQDVPNQSETPCRATLFL